MLDSTIDTEIRRLLVEGNLFHREIARLTGVGRSTVGAIASGKRPNYKPRKKSRYAKVRPRRCACGALINIFPCLACEARRQIAKKKEPQKRGGRK